MSTDLINTKQCNAMNQLYHNTFKISQETSMRWYTLTVATVTPALPLNSLQTILRTLPHLHHNTRPSFHRSTRRPAMGDLHAATPHTCPPPGDEEVGEEEATAERGGLTLHDSPDLNSPHSQPRQGNMYISFPTYNYQRLHSLLFFFEALTNIQPP